MKCVLHFSNGVFNSLAPVKRGDDVDQLRKTEWMGESEGEERDQQCFLVSAAKKNTNFLPPSSILKGVSCVSPWLEKHLPRIPQHPCVEYVTQFLPKMVKQF